MKEVQSWHEEVGLGALWNTMYVNMPTIDQMEAAIVNETERTLLYTRGEILKNIAALSALLGTSSIPRRSLPSSITQWTSLSQLSENIGNINNS